MGIISNLLRSYSGESTTQDAQTPAEGTPVQSGAHLEPHSSTSGDATTSPTNPTQLQQQQGAITSTISKSLEVDTEALYQNPRARTIKQLSVFFAGATFLTLSVFITRRSVMRKISATKPLFYVPSNKRQPLSNGAVEAAEAFALATVNVSSLGLMLTGGAMFALDLVNTADLRRKYLQKQGFLDSKEGSADEEIEEWVKSVLDKRDSGDYKAVTEGLTALVGVLAGKEEEKEKLTKMNAERKLAEGGGGASSESEVD